MDSTQHKSSTKLLSLRSCEIVQRKQYTDETVNISVVKREAITSSTTGGPASYFDGEKRSITSSTFEPLDKEVEDFLKESIILPPIDLCTMPKKYYINPHPTESIMSDNSVNEWWDKVDYSDEESVELKCAKELNKINREDIKRQYKNKSVVADTTEIVRKKTFPITLEMQRERDMRELQEEKEERDEVILKLEKQMVSLYNLKRQYRRTQAAEGCARGRTTLPPLAGGDKLARLRDSLVTRIQMKKIEEEIKMKKQIERKINIVKQILKEQKQKEIELKNQIKEGLQLSVKLKRPKNISRAFDESSKIYQGMENTFPSEDVKKRDDDLIPNFYDSIDDDKLTEPTKKDSNDLIQYDKLNTNISTEVPLMTEVQEMRSPGRSVDKPSKTARKNKGKRDGKASSKKTNKIAKAAEEAPAICDSPTELPASQLRELSQWFENWRENPPVHKQWLQENEYLAFPEENNVLLKPSSIIFKDVKAGRRVQQVTVINTGLLALQCRVLGVQLESSEGAPPVLQATLSGPSKARTGQSWSLTVTLHALEGVGDGSAEVMMLCCRGQLRTRLSVGVRLLTPRAEPVLSTSCVRFGPQMHWCDSPITKYIHVSNPGSVGCLMYWTEVNDQSKPSTAADSHDGESGEQNITNSFGQLEPDQVLMTSLGTVKYILEIAMKKAFSLFRIDACQPLMLPPGSQVSLPVKFVPAFSHTIGDVFTKYRFYFEGEKIENEALKDLTICSRIEHSPFTLDRDVVHMELCYTGGTVQQACVVVHSCARHAHHVVARVPRSLASVVSVVPKRTVVAAKSSAALTVRIVLGWDFLDKPCRYLDPVCGLLKFPVAVWVTDAGAPVVVEAPPLEAIVIASVAPPCPLTLTPSIVDLGVVNTMETVEAELQLSNHWTCPYVYAFFDLPQSVMIEPGGGTGSILPLETVRLRLLYSPRAQDLGVECGRPGGEGDHTFTLRCFTTVSLASPTQNKNSQRQHSTQQITSNGNDRTPSQYTVSLKTSQLSFSKEITSGIKDLKENDVKDFSRDPLTDLSIDDEPIEDESNMRGLDGLKEDEVEFSSIYEDKEEPQEQAIEDLWDFYSNFNFSKPPKETGYGGKLETNTKQDVRSLSVSSNDVLEVSNNKIIEFGEVTNASSALPGDVQEGQDQENAKSEESVSEASKQGDVQIENNVDGTDIKDDGSEEENKQLEGNKDIYQLPDMSQRFASFTVKAHVVDPLVELSSQVVVLPPTPCTSYSIAHIYLRARTQKPCSTHAKITKFKTQFEFRSTSKDLTVKPRQGCIGYKQSKKISIIYSPTLDEKDVYDKALEMKVDKLKWQKIQDMLNEYYNAKINKQTKEKGKKNTLTEKSENTNDSPSVKKGESRKDKGKKSKGTLSVKTKKTKGSFKSFKLKKKSSGPLPDVVIDPAEVTVTDEDITNAKMTMLKYLEPCKKTLNLLCLLETSLGERQRQETLSCEVVCSVIAPTIFLDSPACLDFGPVAVGSSLKMEARIINMSFFYVPKNGVQELPSEHILRVPLRFEPTHCGEFVEAFEVFSDSTVLHLQTRGRGVLPAFTFQPNQDIFTVSTAAGKKADVAITVINDCEALLTFCIHLDYIKEGQLPSPKPTAASSVATSPKQEKGAKKANKGKSLLGLTVLNEELEKCLETDFVTINTNSMEHTEPVFTLLNSEETVAAGETRQITVRFAPPFVTKQDISMVDNPKLVKPSPKNNKKSKTKSDDQDVTIDTKLSTKDGKSKLPKSKKKDGSVKTVGTVNVKLKRTYAAKLSVFLAETRVQSWIIIGTNK